MFIYEKNGAMCVTFKANKPVDAPEYVITIDPETETVSVNGKKFVDPVEEVPAPAVEKPAKKSAKKTEEPTPVAAPAEEEKTVEVVAE